MKSSEFIQNKFQAWALRKNLELQGSEGERGQPNYTKTLEENLYNGELSTQARADFEMGAGGELLGKIPSMSALHSSSAMTVNLFQYWLKSHEYTTLAKLLNIPSEGI